MSLNFFPSYTKPDLIEILLTRLFFWRIVTSPDILEKSPGISSKPFEIKSLCSISNIFCSQFTL